MSNKNENRSYSKVVSINNNGKELQVRVFPNPSKGIVNVSIRKQDGKNINVQVLDASGKEVFHKKTAPQHESDLTFDLSKHGKGFYLVRLISDDEVRTERIIVE